MTDVSRHAVTVLVLLGLVVGAQLAATDVGEEIGPHWSEPEVAAELPATAEGFDGFAADADSRGGTVAWIERSGTGSRVRAVSFRVADGGVSVEDPRTLDRSDDRLVAVDVARSGGTAAVVWERRAENQVYVHVDGETRQVSAPNATRVIQPTVALSDGTPIVAWGEYRDGQYNGTLVVLGEERVERRFGDVVGGDSPALSPVGDGVVVAWVNTNEGVAYVGHARASNGFAVTGVTELGQARAVSSFAGGGTPGVVDVAAEGTRYLRSDMARVSVGRLTDGGPTDEQRVGRGQSPGLAAADGEWLATYVVTRRGSGTDVAYATGDDGGLAVKLPSNSLRAEPVFGPDPGMTWAEAGDDHRVYVSAYQPQGETGPVVRLRTTPERFVFIGLAGIAIGAVTTPLLPWVMVPFLVGFLLTTAVARDLVARVVSGLTALVGRRVDRHDLSSGVGSLHPVVPTVLYVGLNLALLARWAGDGAAVANGIYFVQPLAMSAAALAATAVIALTWRLRSPWVLSAAFAVLQSAALWTTALPAIL